MVDAAEDWSGVAGAWDAYADAVDDQTPEATAALLDRVGIEPGERVLELATGPGTLGPSLSALVGPTGSVVLSDIAPGMVHIAARRNAGRDNVTTATLDASAIDLPAGSFDVVVCRMGLMFTPEPDRALAEIHRVLAPGGRLGALTWAGMEHNPWMTSIGMAAMIHGLITTGPPVGPGAIFSLSDPGRLEALAEGAGFEDVAVEEHQVLFRAPDFDSHFAMVTSLAGPMAVALRDAPAEQREAIRLSVAEMAAPYVKAEGVEIPGRALLLTARS